MKLISLPQIYEKLQKDQAYISKVIKKNKIKTILAKRKNGKVCKAITLKDWVNLIKKIPSLNSKPINKKEITLKDAANRLDLDQSNLRKLIISLNIPIRYRRNSDKTRVVNCINLKEFKRIQKTLNWKNKLPQVN